GEQFGAAEGPADLLLAFHGADLHFDVVVGLHLVQVELEGMQALDLQHVGLFQCVDQGAVHGCVSVVVSETVMMRPAQRPGKGYRVSTSRLSSTGSPRSWRIWLRQWSSTAEAGPNWGSEGS